MLEHEPGGPPRTRPGARTATIGSGGIVATGSAASALAYVNAPWWGIALVAILIITASAGLAAMQLLLPQDSGDRLEWWRDLRRDRARRESWRTRR